MTANKMTANKMTANKMISDTMISVKMTLEEMTIHATDKMTAYKMTRCLFMFMTTDLGLLFGLQPHPTNFKLGLKCFTGLNTLAYYIDAKNGRANVIKLFTAVIY